MSNPANPLDKFVTYTYHFELHASKSSEILKLLETSDVPGAATTSRSPNGTLLINTRNDAHQTIDNVKFTYVGPSVNPTGKFTPNVEVSMEVYEPNGMNFLEKLYNTMNFNEVSGPGHMAWALKVFFVGRTADNNIEVIPKNGIFIPLAFTSFTGDFSYQGSKFDLRFNGLSDFANSNLTNINQISNNAAFGFTNKNITVSGTTVKEALIDLEKKLNDNYENVYSKEVKDLVGARKIRYKISFDDNTIDGQLSLNNRTDYSPGSNMKMNFLSKDPIISWVNEILRSSKDLNSRVADSLEKIRNENHEGVEYLYILPTQKFLDTELLIEFNIGLYNGSDEVLEFDFLFADAGKNVDILGFSMSMDHGMAFFSNSSNVSVGYETGRNPDQNKTDPGQTTNVITDDTVKQNAVINTPMTISHYRKNDIAILPTTSKADSTGFIKLSYDAVPSAKKMFATITEMHGAYNPEFMFQIRGNLYLLAGSIIYDDSIDDNQQPRRPIGVTGPKWLKVNIKDHDYEPFFYTGKYLLLSIESVFSGGKFTQNLHVMMYDKTTTVSTAAPTEKVVQNPETVGTFEEELSKANSDYDRTLENHNLDMTAKNNYGIEGTD